MVLKGRSNQDRRSASRNAKIVPYLLLKESINKKKKKRRRGKREKYGTRPVPMGSVINHRKGCIGQVTKHDV